jgi:hypothetical protein
MKLEACGKNKTKTPQKENALGKVMRLLVIFSINWFGVKLKFNYKRIYSENHQHVRFQIVVPNESTNKSHFLRTHILGFAVV